MTIDLESTYVEEIDKYLDADAKQAIMEAAERKYGGFSGLSIQRWVECIDGHVETVIGDFTGSWLQVYWMRGLEDFSKSYPEMLERLSPKMDADEERAASGLLKSTLIESMLIFARSYFGLHSFNEAEQTTLGDILIAKKAVYNETMFQRRLAKIQMGKAKGK